MSQAWPVLVAATLGAASAGRLQPLHMYEQFPELVRASSPLLLDKPGEPAGSAALRVADGGPLTANATDVLAELHKLQKQVEQLSTQTAFFQIAKAWKRHPVGRTWILLQGALLTLAVLAALCYCFWVRMQAVRDYLTRDKIAKEVSEMSKEELLKVLGPGNLPAWIGSPDCMRVSWVNDLLEQLWPRLQDVFNLRYKEVVEPLIQQSKPRWVFETRVLSFEIGDVPPAITGVKAFKESSSPNHVVMEFSFRWAGTQRVKLLIKPCPPSWGRFAPPGFAHAVSNLLSCKVAIEDVQAEGRLRVAAQPLLGVDRLATVLQVYGGDITFMPGLRSWITWFVHAKVLRPYVLPERLSVPINFLYDTDLNRATGASWMRDPKGMLFLRLIEAVNVWNEDFVFLIHVPDSQTLTGVLYDADPIGADRIGKFHLPISSLLPGEEQDMWLPIEATAKEGRKLEREHLRNARSFGTQQAEEREAQEKHAARLNRVLDEAKSRAKTGLKTLGIGEGECRVRVKAVYHSFGSRELKEVMKQQHGRPHEQAAAQRSGDAPPSSDILTSNRNLIENYLRGGVVYIHLKKATDLDRKSFLKSAGLRPHLAAKILLGDRKKLTNKANMSGRSATWDENVEFVITGDEAGADLKLIVELWDFRLINRCMGIVTVPLSDLMSKNSIRETYKLEGAKNGHLALDLKFVSVLHGS
eukprot:jgi/Astpho2/512/fgenesh1_pg.00011_%23_78_t